jgi:hypothetical protein
MTVVYEDEVIQIGERYYIQSKARTNGIVSMSIYPETEDFNASVYNARRLALSGLQGIIEGKTDIETKEPPVTPKTIIEKGKENKNKSFQDKLSNKCRELKEEGKYEVDEILKFFNYYKAAIEKGWKGKDFDVNRVWHNWVSRIS